MSIPKNQRQKVQPCTVLKFQKNVCKFIFCRIYLYEKVDGIKKRVGYFERDGLQIENKFYYMRGNEIITVPLNGPDETYPLRSYDSPPEGTHKKLLEKQAEFIQSRTRFQRKNP